MTEENFIISSDSTCDLYSDYVAEHGIRIVPLHYTMEENGVLTEGVDAFTEYAQYIGFYGKLRAGGFSRTSMLNYDAHFSHFEKLAKEGAREIVHVSLSGGLSPTANVAAQAAKDISEKYPGCRVWAVDSLAATIGQGALVREAVRLRAEGRSAEETYGIVREMPLHIQYAIIANDLYYLKRGGRVSAVAAAAGTLLKIKPVLSFTREGKLTVEEKCKGMKSEAVRLRAEGRSAEETYGIVREMPLHIQYAIIANDLYYLKRGGRVSAVAAAAGTLLKIKPVLSFTREGKLTVEEKCKGMKKAFAYALAKMQKRPPQEEGRMIRIVHTDNEKEAEELAGMIEARWNFRPEISVMGPVIGSHVGPGSVSVIWKTEEERNDG